VTLENAWHSVQEDAGEQIAPEIVAFRNEVN